MVEASLDSRYDDAGAIWGDPAIHISCLGAMGGEGLDGGVIRSVGSIRFV